MNDLSQRPSKESIDAERSNFQRSFSVLQNTITELEN